MKQVEIPDFEDMFKLAEDIGTLTREKLEYEQKIEYKEAQIVFEVTSNSAYHVNGKVPSMEFIKTTYLRTGFDEEMQVLKAKLNITISKLEKAKLRFQIYRDMIDVWRTISANQRAAVA